MHKPIERTPGEAGVEAVGGAATGGAAAPNLPPLSAGFNLCEADPVLSAALDACADGEAAETLSALGAWWGSPDAEEVARLASENPPRLRALDAWGERVDEVEHHPAWHALLNRSIGAGLSSSAWEEDGSGVRRQHRLRAATLYLAAAFEPAHVEPACLTHAGIAALAAAPDLEAELFPPLSSRRHDRRILPVAEKDGATLALALTERDAGGDLSAVACRAAPAGGDLYAVSGHKWFVSHPMADVYLTLARTGEGVSCLLVPRVLPDGVPNRIHLSRLKDKVGFDALAVAEVEFAGADGVLVGEAGRGLAVVRDTLTLLRLDGAVRAAAVMRAGATNAVRHLRARTVRGERLADAPLMRTVVADLALDCAAATALSMRVAAAYDAAFDSDAEFALARLLTPTAKYFAGKAAPRLLAEAVECVGNFALVGAHPLARLYRDAPLLSVWQGTGNELALETARLVERDPSLLDDALATLAPDLREAEGPLRDRLVDAADRAASDLAGARRFVEQLAFVAAAAALRRDLPRVVSDAFLDSRLEGTGRATYGALDTRFDTAALLDFILPEA